MHSAASEPGAGAGLPGGELVTEVAARLERLFALLRWLSPPSGLSLTSAATLATLERSGPCRITDLAAREGVTQPAMTQLVARLQDGGLADRVPDHSDGRVVLIRITPAGREVLAARRAARAGRLGALIAQLTPVEQQLLAAALPVIDTLASAPYRDLPPPTEPPAAPPVPSARHPHHTDPAATNGARS
jgi:DNA-binding MarR family transcriptional regulator